MSNEIYVRAHYRKPSSKARPKWIVLRTKSDGDIDFHSRSLQGGKSGFSGIGRACLYLKNDAKKKFKDEIEEETIILVAVR